jgi:hypothetical protein
MEGNRRKRAQGEQASGSHARAGAAQQPAEHRRVRRKRESEINRGLRDLDAPGALAALQRLCEQWQLGEEARALTFEQQTMRMFQVFGLSYRDNLLEVLDVDRGSFGLRTVDDTINDAELEAIGLYHRLHELGLLPEDAAAGDPPEDVDADDDADDEDSAAKRSTLQRIVKVMEMVFYAKKVVLSAFQAKLALHQLHLGDGTLDLAPDLDARLGHWALRFRYIEGKVTPYQSLLLYLLDAAMEKRYRKSGGWLYEPVYVDGRNTHAWRPVREIKDFVFSLLPKETAWGQWVNATAAGLKNISQAIDYLTDCHDYQLPELRKKRGVYSFRNGVYVCGEDRFYAFADAATATGAAALSEDVVACKYFDQEFDDYAGVDWRDIPTPHLQSIAEYQGFDADVCRWMYVMLGRLLYPINERDGWQVIPFFKGQAGSGKCLKLNTPVLMASGAVKAVQDIGVGELVMGDDGTPRCVLELARGEDEMFELRPRRKGYPGMTVTREHVLCLKYTNQGSVGNWQYGRRVAFFDGKERKAGMRKFTTANEPELEAFRAGMDRDEVFEMTVAEYMALPDYVKRYLVCYRVPVEFPAAPEPLFDPWAIGAWLGDGHAAGARMTMADADMVSAFGDCAGARGLTLTTCSGSYLYGVSQQDGRRLKSGNPFLQALRAYDLVDNKHVPHALKTGSRATRMAVLAGLLDTDGWKSPRGHYEIMQKRQVLADDIAFLARSLGFAATVTAKRKAAVTLARENTDPAKVDEDGKTRAWGQYWQVNVFGAGLEDLPLRCARKRFAAGELKPVKDALKWGFDVVPVGREPYYGFQTDGNERFLLGDFTVTHNSTIVLKVAKAFYDAQDVGVLSNNIERKFGLSAFHDKCLFVAPEIKNDLGIEQAEFQSVVSGEDIQINQKFKNAFAKTWDVPGVLAGNEVPGWADNSGSVQRRVLLFEFIRAVLNGDMKLGDKLADEMAAILVKANRAYLEAASKYGHVNIWTVLPQYFKNTRDQLAQSVNSVEAFLASSEVLLGADLLCPMDDFKAALKTFESVHNHKSKRYDTDFFRGPFNKLGLSVEKCKRAYRGTNRTREYVFGCDLNNQAKDDDNDLG